MTTPVGPRREHPSTYMVQDRSNQEELTRLSIQDQMLTESMGGALPEQPASLSLHRVLDVGCGTGGWLIALAKERPDISLLMGVDISNHMLEWAREQARAEGVEERIEFHAMDALRMLEFPTHYFDLVNQRLGSSFLRTWDWSKLLQEYQRVVRPGGIIRITESDMVTECSSPAYVRFNQIIFQALHQAGHFFSAEPDGVTSHLARLLKQYAIQQVQTHIYHVEYRAGTPQGQRYFEDGKHAARTLLPFLRKWTQIPADYEELCQQMISETQAPDFVAVWRLLTAWGYAPE